MNDSITVTTIDAERFKSSVFITLGIRGLSFKKQVKNQDALSEYLAQLDAEIKAKVEAGTWLPENHAAVSNGNGGMPKGKAGKAIGTTKTLLFSPALDALKAHLSEAKAKVVAPPQYGGIANPSGIMEGLFELHKDLVPRVNADIAEAQRRLTQDWQAKDGKTYPGFLTAFLADYPSAIERARTAPLLEGGLGPLFNPNDYPTTGEVQTGFGIDRRWVALGVPEGLPPELREQAAEELRADLRNAAETIKDSLAQGLAELIGHAKEVLEVKPGEKPKVIKESLIGNVIQFCEVFSLRNTQGDAQLAALVEEAKAALVGVDPDKCRKFAHIRENTATKFAELSLKIDGLITERKTRIFDLSPD